LPAAYGYWFVSAGRMVPQVAAAGNRYGEAFSSEVGTGSRKKTRLSDI
jgi:hypothetical protein